MSNRHSDVGAGAESGCLWRPATRITRGEAFDQVLCAAVTAVDTLDRIGEHLVPAADPALPLVDHLKASIAAEALSVMERWPA